MHELNPDLKNILPNYKGNFTDENNLFINEELPYTPNYLADVVRLGLQKKPFFFEKIKDKFRLTVVSDTTFLAHNADVIVWLGHCSFFVRLAGVSMLIDPVFFGLSMFVPRKSALPLNPNVFKNIDYVLISHNHRDHLDLKSLKLIVKNNPKTTLLTGLRNDVLLKSHFPSATIQTAAWYQQFNTLSGIEIVFLPTRHWSSRTLTDGNRTLWGSFMIKTNEKTLYFAADSGAANHFAKIGKLYPNIDFCFIGIGTYEPAWFMQPNHLSPQQAAQMCNDTGAKNLIPMHYGTFDLSDEPISQPLTLLKKLADDHKINAKILPLNVGENLLF